MRFGGRGRRKHLLILLPGNNTLPKSRQHPRKGQLCSQLTIVVDAVDQANPNLGMVVGHEDDVKELLTVGVKLAQLRVHCFQRLQHPRAKWGGGCQRAPSMALAPFSPSKTLLFTKTRDLA